MKGSRRGGRRRIIIVIALLALLVGVGAWFLGSRHYVAVPDVAGQSVNEASRTLAVAELSLDQSTTEASDSVPQGDIIRTDPGAGHRARTGSTVKAIVSTGPAVVSIPDVAGTSVDEATKKLRDAKFDVAGTQAVYDGRVPRDQVIGTRPASGTPATTGAQVTLLVSRGGEPLDLPDVAGMSSAEAKRTLTDAGLVVSVTEDRARRQHQRRGSRHRSGRRHHRPARRQCRALRLQAADHRHRPRRDGVVGRRRWLDFRRPA